MTVAKSQLPPASPNPTLAADSAETLRTAAPASMLQETWRRLRRRRSAVAGMFILGSLAVIALLAPVIATHNPIQVLIALEDVARRSRPCIHTLCCPSDQPQHLMGTDGNVRDLFSRLVYGARLSLVIGLSTVTVAIIIGTVLGALAGYAG